MDRRRFLLTSLAGATARRAVVELNAVPPVTASITPLNPY
jgi:hypothetical protein